MAEVVLYHHIHLADLVRMHSDPAGSTVEARFAAAALPAQDPHALG
ncbi:hypothetical protein [Amycolatopsis sp. cg13]